MRVNEIMSTHVKTVPVAGVNGASVRDVRAPHTKRHRAFGVW